MVLGASMTLTVIGLSTATISRIRTRSTVQSNNFTSARLIASSGAEHALAKINSDSNWRTTYNGVTVTRTIGSGAFTWRVVDQGDGDLADSTSDPATLIVTGTDGGASYSQSITLSSGSSSGSGTQALGVMWGVGDEGGELFSISDCEDPINTMTVYGRLKYDDDGFIRDVGREIEAIAIDRDGTAYFVCQRDVGDYDHPVLLKFNINNASTAQDNIVEIVGEINWWYDVTGLAFDPDTGALYAVGVVWGHYNPDRLLIINKETGAVMSNVGGVSGLGHRLGRAQDIVFDSNGQLYALDADDYHDCQVYKVDKTNGDITDIVDNNMGNHIFEGLAWDSVNNRLLAVRESSAYLYIISERTGHNTYLGRLRDKGIEDCEAIGFLPANAGASGSSGIGPVQSSSAAKRLVD